MQAMKEEMQSLIENETYDLVKLLEGRKTLRNKWVFKLKNEDNNSNSRYKTRIVVKGCNQKKDIDFEEIFSLVVKMTSIKAILGLAAKQDLEVEQLDIKTTFLHGDLEEEIYMEQQKVMTTVKENEKYDTRIKVLQRVRNPKRCQDSKTQRKIEM